MFDGLIEVLMSWIAQAFCWIVQQLVSLAIALMQLVSSVMPSVAVPDFLTTYAWPAEMLSFIGWLVPFGALSWMLMAWVSYEVAHFVLLILYRAFMDLL